jgi:hypothetical protein
MVVIGKTANRSLSAFLPSRLLKTGGYFERVSYLKTINFASQSELSKKIAPIQLDWMFFGASQH